MFSVNFSSTTIIGEGTTIVPSLGYITSNEELSSCLFFKTDSSRIISSSISPVSSLVKATLPASIATFLLAKLVKYSSLYLSFNPLIAARAVPDFKGSDIEIFPVRLSFSANSLKVCAKSSFFVFSGL